METIYRRIWEGYSLEDCLSDLRKFSDTHLVYTAPEEYEMAHSLSSNNILRPDPGEWVHKNSNLLTSRNNKLTIVTSRVKDLCEENGQIGDEPDTVYWLSLLENAEHASWKLYWFERGGYFPSSSVFRPHTEFDYLMTSMMHRAHTHRIHVANSLVKHNLIENNLVSWHGLSADRGSYASEYSIPCDLDSNILQYTDQLMATETVLYDRALIDLVVESTPSTIFYTEKTARPICLGKIFFIVGAPGMNLRLRNLGFEIFEEIFDYSQDNNPDLQTRIQSISKQLVRLQDADWNRLHQSVLPKIKHNWELIKHLQKNHPNRPEIMKTPQAQELYPPQMQDGVYTDIQKILRGSHCG